MEVIMKKKITTAFLTLAASFVFAQDAIPSLRVEEVLPTLVQLESKPSFSSIEEKMALKKSFGYLKMGVSDSELPSSDMKVLPGFGLGYRIAAGASAFDISASFNRREIRTDDGKESTYSYSLPKANYLYYITPARNSSFYAGAGLAWGGVRTKEQNEFHGLIPNAAIGYEMNRNATLRSFIQLDVSQPAIAGRQKGDLPKAFAEFSLGAGF
jgi:hypothetical protein